VLAVVARSALTDMVLRSLVRSIGSWISLGALSLELGTTLER
jgi:hypothetical protein